MTEFSFLGDEKKKKEKSPSKLKQKSLLKSIVISKCSRNFPSQL